MTKTTFPVKAIMANLEWKDSQYISEVVYDTLVSMGYDGDKLEAINWSLDVSVCHSDQ
jgi:hypothetical protein